MPENRNDRHHVVVAGGGVAGLEALSALQALAAERVRLTLLEPAAHFALKALSVRLPFAAAGSRRFGLDELAEEIGAEHRRTALAEVRPETRSVVLADGAELGYDSLLVALGAEAREPFEGAHVFGGPDDAGAIHGIVQDLEGEYVRRIVFVVPPGTTWALPLYELALQAAERADDMQLRAEVTILTAEDRPLEVLGRVASDEVAATLHAAGIELRTGMSVTGVSHGRVHAVPGDVAVGADRVVTLPQLSGRRVPGLPSDPQGFLPVDEDGRVGDLPGIYGAGDGTTFPVKQGGLAAQQADAVAAAIARAAGAAVDPAPFRPVLKAELVTGAGSRSVSRELAAGGDGPHTVGHARALEEPLRKVSTVYLAPVLERLAGERSSTR